MNMEQESVRALGTSASVVKELFYILGYGSLGSEEGVGSEWP